MRRTVCAAVAVAGMCAGGADVAFSVKPGDDLLKKRDEIRAVRQPGDRAVVTFAPGTYFVTQTLAFDAQDARAVWRAEKPGTVTLSGGIELPPALFSPVTDHLRGVDGPDDPKVTWIYSGLLPLRTLYWYAAVLLGLGTLAGGVILLRGCWDAAVLGACGLLLGLGYSFLKYRALGDLAIFLAFALLPALGVVRTVGGAWDTRAILVVLPVGLVTLSIVHANNWRDIASDRAAGIRTLPIVVGPRVARIVYVLETLLPYGLVAAYAWMGLVPRMALAALAALPLAIGNLHAPLAPLDRLSARHQLVFGGLYALFLASRF